MSLLDAREMSSANHGWWTDVDDAVLGCLNERGPMSPAELGRALGFSEHAAASVLSMLATEGRVRIRLVEAAGS
jgi:predicted ArsR family transcriptional regulator